MTISLRRGVKFGALSAVLIPLIIPINAYFRGETITWEDIVVGTLAAFVFFTVMGTLTGRVGNDIGEE